MIRIQRALISVSDKTGLEALARCLHEFGTEILSTGGTANFLRDRGIPVVDVSGYTGFPEIMDGRVKTLHPKIHGGLLALRGNESHLAQMEAQGIKPIDMVVDFITGDSEHCCGASQFFVVQFQDIAKLKQRFDHVTFNEGITKIQVQDPQCRRLRLGN